MCEALICVQDKVPLTHPLRRLNIERGDVIVVAPDGWSWGREELKHLGWRIVRLPGLPTSALQDLTTPVTDRDGRLLAVCGRGIDLDSIKDIEAAMKAGEVIELPPAQTQRLLAARKNKTTRLVEIG